MMYMIEAGLISPCRVVAHRLTPEVTPAGKRWTAEMILDNHSVFLLGIFARRQDAALALREEKALYCADEPVKKIRPKGKHHDLYLAIKPRCAQMHELGLSPGEIAMILQARGVPTVRGGPWTAELVRGLLV